MSTLSVDKPFICIECQKWVVHLNSTKNHDIIPWQQDHLIPAPPTCATESFLPDSNLLPVFYGCIRKLISPTLLSLSDSLSFSLSPFLSVFHKWCLFHSVSLSLSVSSVFYSCCNSHLTFLLGDYFIMRPQLPPSLSPYCPPPFQSLLIIVHVSFLFFKTIFKTFVMQVEQK